MLEKGKLYQVKSLSWLVHVTFAAAQGLSRTHYCSYMTNAPRLEGPMFWYLTTDSVFLVLESIQVDGIFFVEVLGRRTGWIFIINDDIIAANDPFTELCDV